MNNVRVSFSMTEINDLLICIGGFGEYSSFEYINVLKGTKWIKRDMHFGIWGHCSAKINQSTILITGGWLDGKVSKSSQILCYQNDV